MCGSIRFILFEHIISGIVIGFVLNQFGEDKDYVIRSRYNEIFGRYNTFELIPADDAGRHTLRWQVAVSDDGTRMHWTHIPSLGSRAPSILELTFEGRIPEKDFRKLVCCL